MLYLNLWPFKFKSYDIWKKVDYRIKLSDDFFFNLNESKI
jgi:hypothetical protein